MDSAQIDALRVRCSLETQQLIAHIDEQAKSIAELEADAQHDAICKAELRTCIADLGGLIRECILANTGEDLSFWRQKAEATLARPGADVDTN